MSQKTIQATDIIINLLNELKAGSKTDEEFRKQVMISLGILEKKIDQLTLDIQNVKENRNTKKKSETTKTPQAKTSNTPAKLVLTNTGTWFKYMWKMQKEDIIQKYLNQNIIDELFKAKSEDSNLKEKSGDALIDEEAKWIWNKFIVKVPETYAKVKKGFELYRENENKLNLTPADEK